MSFPNVCVEFYGPSSTGKSRTALEIAAAVSAADTGGHVLLIDTQASFSLDFWNSLFPAKAPDNLFVKRIYDVLEFMSYWTILEQALDRNLQKKRDETTSCTSDKPQQEDGTGDDHHSMQEEEINGQLRLIVIDSIGGLLAPLAGNALVARVGTRIRRLARRFGIAILVRVSFKFKHIDSKEQTINYAVANTASGAQEPYRPALGKYWACMPDARLLFPLKTDRLSQPDPAND